MMNQLRDNLSHLIANQGVDFLIQFAWAGAALVAFYYIIAAVSKKVEQKILGDVIHPNKYTERAAQLISHILFIFLMICAFLVSLEIVGLNTAIILGGMTIAIGFAMEATMGNMIAGVILLSNPHLKVGQKIQLLGSINQLVTVEEFHIRYTVVRTLSKQRVIIPNSKLLHTPMQTKHNEPLMRAEIHISIARHYDLEMIKSILTQCINSNEHISHPEQTAIHIHDFSKQGYDLVCYYFYSPVESGLTDFVVGSAIRKSIANTFAEKDIAFSYPRETIHVRPKDKLGKYGG